MSKKVNKTAIGLFVIFAVVLLMAAILIFGSGSMFKRTYKYILYFDGSVKGLSIGAPVTFRGVKIGAVKNISLIYNDKTKGISLPVVIEIEPRIKGAPSLGDPENDKKMIAMGLRAKLEIQNLLAGQLMISFDFYPNKPAVLYGITKDYPELPTIHVSQDIFELINDAPITEITMNLNDTLKGLNKLVNAIELDSTLVELRSTLQEVRQASHSFRLLTEYLEQHPEALLKGKK